MEISLVEQVRRFNRTMTERVGVLNDHFLGRDHPLGEARLLWEIGEKGTEVRELRRRLSLDSAYVSRLLRSLEQQCLLVVRTSEQDGRVRLVHLTEAGLRERVALDQQADAFARSLLEPLSEGQRVKLGAAMAQVERLLIASMVQITVVNPTSQDARWCLERYFAELGQRFEAGFDPTLSITAYAHELTPPAGLLLVARLREEPVGCGALKFHETAPSEIKRMWVAKGARGLGLGRRLLEALEHEARQTGVKILHLETNRTLTEAIELYRHAGYQEVEAFNDEPYAHYWFEKRL
ncbi:bifunctional helix-turn-helix transcriptional regulator/GNAT family N-acetyltransferase [Ktedonospora formicarum]|uniref:Putative transcriptional regulator, MarR family protein n=1 Tax=Ktedonospora formicarum TaxID=2778364 RepID=A0A8J3IAM9_9CHLR|nr:bifunctional helix-turn-helix transcriptional regulator/GNAT family N-acetyltransferase [Ktedonospora formicarum]GHO47814.1 putative transcriptional regulator, MarR family protein [Ktedonospora formicarum]